jgi:hypothetical protein
VKERVLNEKEAELANFQRGLEQKGRDVDSVRLKVANTIGSLLSSRVELTVVKRLDRLSSKLYAAHAQQMASVEATRLEVQDFRESSF